ncbi:MAG TPA: HlyD family efflux transporter periplasmic adaptor subunit [Oligoflexia bacterium]|nr:HlyD family efflux transporter periplasmic adaptor subunit [Oligoflexia bacterium]HMP26852.1 HlyD family efflux transporter periplasmic adaptor subunit [Oligoflexia bacterium]
MKKIREEIKKSILPSYIETREVLGDKVISLKDVSSPKLFLKTAKVIGFTFLAIVVALIFAPWTQNIFATGKVIAYSPNNRPQNIEAPVEGRIAEWFVIEGQQVQEGEPIARIEDLDPQLLSRIEMEVEAKKMKVSAIERAIEASNNNLTRKRKLSEKGLVSQRDYELAELEIAKLQSDLAIAQVEFAQANIKLQRQSSQIIRSPRDGTIVRVFAATGGVYVKAGFAIATLVPNAEDPAVELYVDGNDIPLISIGREARLQFQGWPAIQFAGWPSVAIGSFSGVVGMIDQTDDGTGKFRVLVFPKSIEDWPAAPYLRQGVRAVGWILLDDVKLGWELWRLFNGFPPTVENQPDLQLNTRGIQPFIRLNNK